MTIQDIPVAELKPYSRNPRKNAKAVHAVAASIREFGFRVPIVLDRSNGVNEVICGHTRLLAAKELGLETVPCTFADDLTPKQVKAFRLADNRVSELADWDKNLLAAELDDLLTFDDIGDNSTDAADWAAALGDFGFDLEKELNPDPPDNCTRLTVNKYKLQEFDPNRTEGFYQMPVLTPCTVIPEQMVAFHVAHGEMKEPDPTMAVHFYIDDYRFERVWTCPAPYVERLQGFAAALTPDFSLYMDMPIAMKVWNVYRSRLIGQIMQDAGLAVIPTLQWAEEATFTFCFDGLPKNSVVSVSTIGVKRDKDAVAIWYAGMDEAIRRLEPSCVLVYGGDIGYEFTCPVKYYESLRLQRARSHTKKESETDG